MCKRHVDDAQPQRLQHTLNMIYMAAILAVEPSHRHGSRPFVESLLRLFGLGWPAPDFSTLSRRQKALVVNIPHRGSGGPLHLPIDSTGLLVEGEGVWHTRKHGGSPSPALVTAGAPMPRSRGLVRLM